MPNYTYRCEYCNHHFDLHQAFEDLDPTTCPNCGHENELQRVYKPVGVVFKGSGFYATDNKSKSGLAVNGSKSGSEDSPKEKSSKTSDASESKSEKKETPPAEKPAAKDSSTKKPKDK